MSSKHESKRNCSNRVVASHRISLVLVVLMQIPNKYHLVHHCALHKVSRNESVEKQSMGTDRKTKFFEENDLNFYSFF